MAKTKLFAPTITMPVLMQVAGDDRLVHSETSRDFFASLKAADKTLFFYDQLYHEIYNEQAEDRKQVLSDLINWLTDRI